MARSRIPYTDLETELKAMYSSPIYARVKLNRPDRYNNLKAPITIYDRTTGNYARYGYLCNVSYQVFQGFEEDYEGKFRSIYEMVTTDVVIPIQLL